MMYHLKKSLSHHFRFYLHNDMVRNKYVCMNVPTEEKRCVSILNFNQYIYDEEVYIHSQALYASYTCLDHNNI